MTVYILMHTAEIGRITNTDCVGAFSSVEKAQRKVIECMRHMNTHCDQEYWQILEKEME